MMHSYQTFLFDIDDTLIDFRKSEALSLKQTYEHFFSSIEYERFLEDYERINRKLWKQVEEEAVSVAVVSSARFQKLTDLYGMNYFSEISAFYDRGLVQHSEWIEGARSFLESIKDRKIGFVSNSFSKVQRAKVKRLGLSDYSRTLMISEEVGVSKPHPKIFEAALEELHTRPQDAIMVGDSLTSDGAGAKQLGMAFCWYNPLHLKPAPHSAKPDFIVSDWKSLLCR